MTAEEHARQLRAQDEESAYLEVLLAVAQHNGTPYERNARLFNLGRHVQQEDLNRTVSGEGIMRKRMGFEIHGRREDAGKKKKGAGAVAR
jgi:hypothetical protein